MNFRIIIVHGRILSASFENKQIAFRIGKDLLVFLFYLSKYEQRNERNKYIYFEVTHDIGLVRYSSLISLIMKVTKTSFLRWFSKLEVVAT